MDEENKPNVVESAFAKAEEYVQPQIVMVKEPDSGIEVPVVITANGEITPVDEGIFDQYRVSPKHRHENATLYDIDSLIQYVNRFSGDHSLIFANPDRDNPSITAVIDYHAEGNQSRANWGEHRANFRFPLSDEWKAWTAKDGVSMNMVEFAQFLEDHIVDVLAAEYVNLDNANEETKRFIGMMGGKGALADPAKLMEIANNLSINENSVSAQAQKLSSGEAVIEFRSEHDTSVAGQKVTIPKLFALGIPVFKNDTPYRVFARFRYRKAGAGIAFWYDLWRTDIVFDDAFDGAIKKINEETKAPVLLGKDRG